MTLRIGWLTMLGVLLAAGPTAAQTGSRQGLPADRRGPAGPTLSPPQGPALRRLPDPQEPPTAPQPPPSTPFPLTPQQEEALDRVLNTWEQRSAQVRSFTCKFTRWEFDPVFGSASQAAYIDQGEIAYRAPDKGMFRVLYTAKDGKMVAIGSDRAEHWVCDGKSIYEYDFKNKQLIQHTLPPERQGKMISDTPLPFLFGAEAGKLKGRYFLRLVAPPPPHDPKDYTCLEAYPRFQQDAANFRRAELILTNEKMTLYALQIYWPNGQNRTVYQFHKPVINDPLDFIKNPFHPLTPPFWKKVQEPAARQVSRPPRAVPSR